MSSKHLIRGLFCAAVLLAAPVFAEDKTGEAVKKETVTTPDPKVPAPATTVTPAVDDTPELPRAKLEEGVFLQSGAIKIMAADVDKVLLLMLTEEKRKNPKNVPAPDRVMRARVEISQVLLTNALVEKYARDNKLQLEADKLERFIELKKLELQRDGSTFEQMLADSGQTEAEFRRFWSAKISIETYASAKLTEQEIEDFFTKNKDEMPLRSAAHILFQYKGADSAPRNITRSKADAKAAAEAALKQAQAGKDFAELASASDDDATKSNGGALAPFPLKGKEAMVDAFGKAAYALEKIGDLSPVVETLYGFHIIKLTGIRDKEYKVEIRRYLIAEKFNELMNPILLKALEAAKFNEALTTATVK